MADFTYDIRAMLRKFGVVTVMDVKAYKTVLFDKDQSKAEATGTPGSDGYVPAKEAYSIGEWNAVETLKDENLAFTLNTLKIANINQEGPTKTITGGQNADTLLKYGKTVTVEMQEALGRYDVLNHIYGVNYSPNHQIATFTDRFPSELTIVGTTFVIDQATGAKQPINIVIPRFLGDGIFNLTQDAEGDATVFDLNGNILKFEGGMESTSAFNTEQAEFSKIDTETHPTAHENWDGRIYKKGADNEFYFMTTYEGLKELQTKGYRETWNATEKTAA